MCAVEHVSQLRSDRLWAESHTMQRAHFYRQMTVVAHEQTRRDDVRGDLRLAGLVWPQRRDVCAAPQHTRQDEWSRRPGGRENDVGGCDGACDLVDRLDR